MAKSLSEYAAANPQEMPAAEREQMQLAAEIRTTQQERKQERAHIDRLKASILAQLQQGNAPQYILYSALEAIGLLTNDAEWTQQGKQCLDNVYADLMQQSILTDNAAIAAARIEQMQATYNERLRRQLETQLKGYQKIAKGLNDAIAALDEIDP